MPLHLHLHGNIRILLFGLAIAIAIKLSLTFAIGTCPDGQSGTCVVASCPKRIWSFRRVSKGREEVQHLIRRMHVTAAARQVSSFHLATQESYVSQDFIKIAEAYFNALQIQQHRRQGLLAFQHSNVTHNNFDVHKYSDCTGWSP